MRHGVWIMVVVGDTGSIGGSRLRRALTSLQARAIGIYLGVHALMLPALWWAWTRQGPNRSSYPNARPGFLAFLALSWDGAWYQEIAVNGYPSPIPLEPVNGVVPQSAWAFFPLFPVLVRGVMAATSLPFEVASLLVAFVAGGAASVVVALLVRDAAGAAILRRPGLPLLAVAGLAVFPSGAVAVLGYSESVALLLIGLSLWLIHRRTYLWAMIPVLALGLTRAVALPLVAVVVWHGLQRWRSARANAEPVPARHWWRLGVLALATLVSGVVWPVVTAVVSGVPNAYFVIQSAWRVGNTSSMPFAQIAAKLAQWLGPVALPAAVAAAVAIGLVSLLPSVARLGPELQSWGGAYLIYVLAVSTLQSSLLRFALLSITVPMALVAWPKRRWVQFLAMGVGLALQAIWLGSIWVFDGKGDAFPP
jgi:hypothetical protein